MEPNLKSVQQQWHGSLRAYLIGFSLCIFLTSISFFLVFSAPFSTQTKGYTLIVLAVAQAICQLIFFLHLGQEEKPRWESLTFYFMVLVLAIVVLGSLWIMFDLNERVMNM